MKELELKGQTAIVTGAGRGIGRSVALMLANAAAHVILAARTEAELEAVRSEIAAAGGSADVFSVDLASEANILKMFGRVHEEHGKLDILVNNAGCGAYGPTAEVSTEDLDRILAVNLRAVFICCREAIKSMIPAESGTIINISSVVGFKGYPEQAAYTASKHGVVGLSKSLAAEAHEHGIRISVVEPGGTDTEMVRRARPDIPTAELLSPDDVADAVEYLLSLPDRAAVDEIYIRRRSSTPW